MYNNFKKAGKPGLDFVILELDSTIEGRNRLS